MVSPVAVIAGANASTALRQTNTLTYSQHPVLCTVMGLVLIVLFGWMCIELFVMLG